MELASITVRFESPEEQEFVEKNIEFFTVLDGETWGVDDSCGFKSWTEFAIDGCTFKDVEQALTKVEELWKNNQKSLENSL